MSVGNDDPNQPHIPLLYAPNGWSLIETRGTRAVCESHLGSDKEPQGSSGYEAKKGCLPLDRKWLSSDRIDNRVTGVLLGSEVCACCKPGHYFAVAFSAGGQTQIWADFAINLRLLV